MKIEQDYWQSKQIKLFEEICTYDGEVVKISKDKFSQLHSAEKQHLTRFAIKKLTGSLHNISFDIIKRIVNLDRVGSKVYINTLYEARLSSEYIYLFSNKAQVEKNDDEKQGIELYQHIFPISMLSKVQLNNEVVALDFDKIKGKLYTRTRIAGDQFVPFGMKGHKKIKDYFIDEKVPFIKRDKIQLVCDEEKIIWVENMRISELVKITPDTKNIIIISFQELVELN